MGIWLNYVWWSIKEWTVCSYVIQVTCSRPACKPFTYLLAASSSPISGGLKTICTLQRSNYTRKRAVSSIISLVVHLSCCSGSKMWLIQQKLRPGKLNWARASADVCKRKHAIVLLSPAWKPSGHNYWQSVCPSMLKCSLLKGQRCTWTRHNEEHTQCVFRTTSLALRREPHADVCPGRATLFSDGL